MKTSTASAIMLGSTLFISQTATAGESLKDLLICSGLQDTMQYDAGSEDMADKFRINSNNAFGEAKDKYGLSAVLRMSMDSEVQAAKLAGINKKAGFKFINRYCPKRYNSFASGKPKQVLRKENQMQYDDISSMRYTGSEIVMNSLKETDEVGMQMLCASYEPVNARPARIEKVLNKWSIPSEEGSLMWNDKQFQYALDYVRGLSPTFYVDHCQKTASQPWDNMDHYCEKWIAPPVDEEGNHAEAPFYCTKYIN